MLIPSKEVVGKRPSHAIFFSVSSLKFCLGNHSSEERSVKSLDKKSQMNDAMPAEFQVIAPRITCLEEDHQNK